VDPFLEKFIADIVKGANDSFASRSRSGERLTVQRGGDGYEEKLANHAGLGSLAGTLMHQGMGSHVGAALGADEGHRGSAAIGSVLGGSLGNLAGSGVAQLLHMNPEQAQLLGRTLGSMGGASIGGEANASSFMDRMKGASLHDVRNEGAKTAAARFGIKEAFIAPLLGSIAGPALARAGVGALARGAGGSAIGGMASKVLPHIGGGMGGMAFDAASSMAGGALGNKLQPQGPMG
jgi:hypothetical protein